MRASTNLLIAAVALIVGRAAAAPITTVHPGNADAIVITIDNTVNATTQAPSNKTMNAPKLDVVSAQPAIATKRLPLSLINNFGGGAINAYVTGLNSNNQLVILQPDGTFYCPTADPSIGSPQAVTANVAIPLGGKGSTTTITLPDYISAARVWFAEGELQFFTEYNSASGGPSLVEPSANNPDDPSADVNWGFVELTNIENGGLFANISYVDFVGLILGMELLAGDGSTQTAPGLQPGAVSAICGTLVGQAAQDGQPWGDLCQADSSGKLLRVVAPTDYVSVNRDAFGDYWTDYSNQVFSHYSSNTLTIDTQGAAGEVGCTVQGGLLTCDGDNRGYAQPTQADIFGCNSGPFAIEGDDNDVHRAVVPRLCAAFHRTTLLLDGSNVQPSLSSSSYYTTTPTNWYSKAVHQNEVDEKGYAFAYDDVNPAGENESGVVSDPNPQRLSIIVGGPLS